MNTTAQDNSFRYLPAAQAALQQYPIKYTNLQFIAHNAGVVFRVDSPEQVCILKLHDRVGEGINPSYDQLEIGMQWLTGIARDTDITVQTPIAASTGTFVSTVSFDDKSIHCTLQHWLHGDSPNGPFTEHQIGQIGTLMAKLHRHNRSATIQFDGAMVHGSKALSEHVLSMRGSLDLELFSQSSYEIVKGAQDKIQQIMRELGDERDVWGPIHGDIHYDNILLSNGDVYPIDFTGLRIAHYLYDIGVTLHHTFHQGQSIRQAFLQGYQQIIKLPPEHLRYLEAFFTYTAIDNLTWNATIPEQVVSPLFQKNLHQLIFTFCRGIVEDISFFDTQK